MSDREIGEQIKAHMWANRPVNQDAVMVYWVRYFFKGEGRGPKDYLRGEYYDGDTWIPTIEGQQIEPAIKINGYLSCAINENSMEDTGLAAVRDLIKKMETGA